MTFTDVLFLKNVTVNVKIYYNLTNLSQDLSFSLIMIVSFFFSIHASLFLVTGASAIGHYMMVFLNFGSNRRNYGHGDLTVEK